MKEERRRKEGARGKSKKEKREKKGRGWSEGEEILHVASQIQAPSGGSQLGSHKQNA